MEAVIEFILSARNVFTDVDDFISSCHRVYSNTYAIAGEKVSREYIEDVFNNPKNYEHLIEN